MYITIQSFNNMHGSKPLKLNGLIKLVKEPDNKYDAEAIACEMRYFGKIGYVANSTHTVYGGTVSAGRIYDKIGDYAYATVMFITHSAVIALVIPPEKFEKDDKADEESSD